MTRTRNDSGGWVFEASRTLSIRKEAFICAEEACDILVDISDCQRTLKSKHAKRDKFRWLRCCRFEMKVVIFLNLWACWLDYSKVHAKLNLQKRSLHRLFGRHHIQILGYNQVPDSLKSFLRTGSRQVVRVMWNHKRDTARKRGLAILAQKRKSTLSPSKNTAVT